MSERMSSKWMARAWTWRARSRYKGTRKSSGGMGVRHHLAILGGPDAARLDHSISSMRSFDGVKR